jgi:hypothetical protein
MDKRKSKLFSDVLLPNEDILWSGQPSASPTTVFTPHDLFFIPFSVVWLGFALFWEAGVLTANAPLLFKLWGIPFVVVGVHNLVGRFIYKFWKKRHTHYAITNQRVLILYKSLTQNVQTLHIDRLPGLSKSIGLLGLGTITFGFTPNKPKRHHRFTWHMEAETPGFYGIEDGDEVFALITGLRRPYVEWDEPRKPDTWLDAS